MGCFSYLCKICGEPINSTTFKGEGVKLWLLQEGKVLEEKTGNYDSYGAVIGKHEWINDWGEILDLVFNSSCRDGIAAVHTECWDRSDKRVPVTISDGDENQGWGKIVGKESDITESIFYSKINTNCESKKQDDLFLKELNNRVSAVLEKAQKVLDAVKIKIDEDDRK